ncbi:MAG: ABC transporter ATP-binding protein [Oscillospiraceae bacterium]|nr:ABC transporter ATP-binding protein [Oscillospiraceae bacterium]
MKKIFENLLHYKSSIPVALLFMTAATVCDLMLPTIMSNIVDKGIYLSDMEYIKQNCLYMFIVALTGLVTVVIGRKLTAEIVAGFCCDLRRMVFRKVNTMTFGEMNEIGTAALITRSTHDTETLGWIASIFCGNIITIPVLFIGGVVLSFRKDVILSLILLLFVPVLFAVVVLIGRKIEPLWRIADEFIDKQNDIMRERLRGIRVIRAFDKEEHEHGRISEATVKMAMNIIKSNVSMGIIAPLALFMLNFSVVLIVYIGSVRMETGASAVSAGDIFAVIQYVTLVMTSIINAAFVIVMIPHAKVAANRIGEVVSAKGYDDEIPEEDLEFSGGITFDNVSFRYDGATEPAVSNISFRIEPGQKVSVIGGTGSGKSTLVSLMLCFRMPTEGKVIYDGRATETLSHKTVRRNISCVLQNSSIYSGTIRDNIVMGKPHATDEEIREAAEIAELSDFVDSLEKGFEHELNQSGKNLSGGQKQRLSIARAVIRNAPIYIFDDSFSALDFLTESRVRTKLSKKAAGKTQIIITQRVTSAMNSDLILVMDNGKLVDSGKHSELLERCKIYREIYASQTGGANL